MSYLITLQRSRGTGFNRVLEEPLTREYADDYFKMSEEDIGANMLNQWSDLIDREGEPVNNGEGNEERTFPEPEDPDEVLPPDPEALDPNRMPDEGDEDHPQFLNEEEREENRETIKNL